MNLKYSLFILHWIFLIICLNIPKIECEERNILFRKGSFKRNAVKSSSEDIKLMGIGKHFKVIFNDLINITINSENSSTRNHILHIFDYIYEGCELISNVWKPNLKYPFDLSLEGYINPKTEKFLSILESIEYTFDFIFINYLGDFDGYTNQTIEYFLSSTISNDTFKNNLEFLYIHTLQLQNQNSTNIFKMYFQELNYDISSKKSCGVPPKSYRLFNLYSQSLIGTIKGYTMLIIGYEFSYLLKNKTEAGTIQLDYINRYQKAINSVLQSAYQLLNSLVFEHQVFYNCDPPKWKEGETYNRVKNYVSQAMSKLKGYDSGFISKENVSKESECANYMIQSDFDKISIYTLRCPEIFDTNPNLYGDCLDQPLKKEFLSFSYSNLMVKCSYLDHEHSLYSACYCDKLSDPRLSIRKLSLREFYTNTTQNRVVTGIRFAEKNGVITIEIQDSKLTKGVIDPETAVWHSNKGHPPKNGLDFVTLDNECKSFNLDDIPMPFGQLVTGVKFEVLDNNHITLVVRGTIMYNHFMTWQSNNHQWHYPKILHHEDRENIPLKDFQNSAELNLQNEEISRSGRNYVNLAVGVISEEFKNLPVHPFFDLQNLTSDAPLGGLGLFYKGFDGFGGFLAFKLADSEFNYNIITEYSA